jgi:3-carboxy-cis,cis-muconate cycloisomerase
MTVNPADSEIFGALFGTDAMRALFSDRRRVQAMLDVEAALARAQARLGLIPSGAARDIAKAAKVENVSLAALAKGTALAGVPVAALADELRRAVGDKSARWVHCGATSQDILDTALVLLLREGLELIEAGLRRVGDSLAVLAKRHRLLPMAGRTLLQQALPISFGYKSAVWLAPLAGHLQRLEELRRRLLVVQFGGAAGTLAALPSHRRAAVEGLARELGLGVAASPWQANREAMAEAASVLGLICGSLAKFATDIVLLSQTELGEVSEAKSDGRGGSSALPQKQNPVASIQVLACTRGVLALVPLMLGALAGEHERSAGAWQSEALALPQIFVLSSGALAHAEAVAAGLTVDAARMKANLGLSKGLIVSEAVMVALVEKAGRSAAQEIVKRASQQVLTGRVSFAEALAADKDAARHLDRRAIARLTEPANYLGESSQIVDRVLAVWRRAVARAAKTRA